MRYSRNNVPTFRRSNGSKHQSKTVIWGKLSTPNHSERFHGLSWFPSILTSLPPTYRYTPSDAIMVYDRRSRRSPWPRVVLVAFMLRKFIPLSIRTFLDEPRTSSDRFSGSPHLVKTCLMASFGYQVSGSLQKSCSEPSSGAINLFIMAATEVGQQSSGHFSSFGSA